MSLSFPPSSAPLSLALGITAEGIVLPLPFPLLYHDLFSFTLFTPIQAAWLSPPAQHRPYLPPSHCHHPVLAVRPLPPLHAVSLTTVIGPATSPTIPLDYKIKYTLPTLKPKVNWSSSEFESSVEKKVLSQDDEGRMVK